MRMSLSNQGNKAHWNRLTLRVTALPRSPQIRLRSSWGLKGLLMPNAPGTIDEDYRGEIKVMLHNLTSFDIKINAG